MWYLTYIWSIFSLDQPLLVFGRRTELYLRPKNASPLRYFWPTRSRKSWKLTIILVTIDYLHTYISKLGFIYHFFQGCTSSGLVGDANTLVERARRESKVSTTLVGGFQMCPCFRATFSTTVTRFRSRDWPGRWPTWRWNSATMTPGLRWAGRLELPCFLPVSTGVDPNCNQPLQ